LTEVCWLLKLKVVALIFILNKFKTKKLIFF
jgi:hypothetical protein